MSEDDFYDAKDDPAETRRRRNPLRTACWVLGFAGLWAVLIFAAVKFPTQFKNSALVVGRVALQKQAVAGDPNSEALLGAMYEQGTGGPVDYAAALDWYRKAAEQGNSFGEFGVGLIYYNGEGVPQNYKEAFKWMRLSANHGFPQAQIYFGTMYRDGYGVAQDNVQAYMWYQLSAQGRSYRDALGARMTVGQIAEAKRLAGLWKPAPEGLDATP